jgi:hypothetical protein
VHEMLSPTHLFGSRRRSSVLILLALLEESYPAELARLLDAHPYSIQTIVDDLESEGVLITRRFGKTRRVQLDPRFPGARELHALLWKLGEQDVELQQAAARRRGRPRRKGKPGA